MTHKRPLVLKDRFHRHRLILIVVLRPVTRDLSWETAFPGHKGWCHKTGSTLLLCTPFSINLYGYCIRNVATVPHLVQNVFSLLLWTNKVVIIINDDSVDCVLFWSAVHLENRIILRSTRAYSYACQQLGILNGLCRPRLISLSCLYLFFWTT